MGANPRVLQEPKPTLLFDKSSGLEEDRANFFLCFGERGWSLRRQFLRGALLVLCVFLQRGPGTDS